ncbi:winged helix DNA-binding domain-containing protein [Micromonospora sp. WMMD1082]|uniref:winged helix DNA-binding domain-containing protein n=1 Tax=Micromonospora sp. WMMD1082 TaxID=3016104 RepID=UPI0024163F51|nr:winged helix DNA-binding domain-containing protein [Micromonospora sp. WMMD1082]MDG4797050.1 winged helix DNA-binding domain-containing protein [Micromonospora sp. WMMD1082]
MAVAAGCTWDQVNARRLERAGLTGPRRHGEAAIGQVATAQCGVHAQVMSAAEWSLGSRLDGVSRQAVQDALWRDHRLVKTRGPRGTVHLLAAAELPMWTGALSALPAGQDGQPPGVRMTRPQIEAVIEAIGDALREADLTVDELTEAIAERVGDWAADRVMEAFGDRWPRWRQVEHEVANRGVLCFGPLRGRKVTYTSLSRLLPGCTPAPGEVALTDLLERYLWAYGPATPAHVAQWLSIPRTFATEMFRRAADRLEPIDLEGEKAWVVAGDREFDQEPPAGLRLLPYFDAYVIGCHPRDRLFAGRAARRGLANGQAGTFPVLLVDGQVAGVWHQRKSGRRIDVTVEPLDELSAARRRALDEEAERLAAFFGARATVRIGPITVGGHA